MNLQIPNDSVRRDDVKFFLYTKNRKNEELFNTRKFPTEYRNYVFIIHGWINDHEASWIFDMTKAILKNDGIAVIQVDWSRPAKEFYAVSASNVRAVGKSKSKV